MDQKGDIKRKWQIALRRYLLENKPSFEYARFFGLPISLFQKWMELQFTEEMTWLNFGKVWQIEHVVPVSFFDLENENDLFLCWNFINIRPGIKNAETTGTPWSIDICIRFYKDMFVQTGFELSNKMVDRLTSFSIKQSSNRKSVYPFFLEHKAALEQLSSFQEIEFELLNKGVLIENIKEEANSIRLLSNWGK